MIFFRRRRIFVALLFCLIVSHERSTIAQGFDPNFSVDAPSTVIDGDKLLHVDLMSGALNINIPLYHFGGRGLDTIGVANYTSKVWNTQYSVSGSLNIFNEQFGLSTNQGNGWSIGDPRLDRYSTGSTICNPNQGDDCYEYIITGQTTKIDGSTTSWASQLLNSSLAMWSYDGSYRKLMPDGNSIYDKDGASQSTVTYVGTDDHYHSYVVQKDRNGNTIANSVDTLGRTEPVVTYFVPDPAVGLSVDHTISYYDANNVQQTITFSYITKNIVYPWASDLSACGTTASYECVIMPGPRSLLSSIQLPGTGGTYHFEYTDVDTNAGTSTGELSKITLPTGGYVRFTYDFNPGIMRGTDLSGAYRVVTKRIVSSDGNTQSEQTWNYSYGSTTTVTDPLLNVHSETFDGMTVSDPLSDPQYTPVSPVPVATQTKDTDSQGNVLQQVDRVYTYDTGQQPYNFYVDWAGSSHVNNPRVVQETKTLYGSSAQAITTYGYDTYGNVTSETIGDWGGATLKTITRTYLADQNTAYAADNVHILDLLASEAIAGNCGSNSGTCSTKSLVYDGYTQGRIHIGLQSTGGTVVQHDYTNYGSATTLRGNATQVIEGQGLNGGSATRDMAYDDLGNVVETMDANGNATLYSYVDSFYGPQPSAPTRAFATMVTKPTTANGVSHVERGDYYLNDGHLAAYCGENFPAASTCTPNMNTPIADYAWWSLDGLDRLTNLIRADGGYTAMTYPDPNHVQVSNAIGLAATTVYDGLGRRTSTTVTSVSPQIETTYGYDSLGRLSSQSNPFYIGQTSISDGTTQFGYDGMNRLTTTTTPSGVSSTSYSGNTTVETDAASHSIKHVADATGRLTDVYEDPGGLNLHTQYVYDALGNLTGATQFGASGETARSRSFTYNSLSRLLTANNPETGVLCYGVLSSGSCQGDYDGNGNLLAKTDARGQTVSFQYDTLNRLILKTAPGARNQAYGYDGKGETYVDLGAPWNVNAVGRLSHTSDETAVASNYAYDSMGRMIRKADCSPSDCSYTDTQVGSYDLMGNLAGLTYPDGRQITMTYDSAARLQTVPGYISSISYWPSGRARTTSYANGITETATENSNLQICETQANYGSTKFLDRQYFYGVNNVSGEQCNPVANNNGNIWNVVDGLGGQDTQMMQYDTLNRLKSWSASSVSSSLNQLFFKYDSFGNNYQFASNVTLDLTQIFDNKNRFIPQSPYLFNQMTCNGASGESGGYDAAGNMLCWGQQNYSAQAYVWDAESHLTQVKSEQNNNTYMQTAAYTYDAGGSRVRSEQYDMNTGLVSTWREYTYFNGQVVAERDQTGAWTDYIYVNSKKAVRISTSQPQLHIHGNDCASCSSGYVNSYLSSPIIGYTIQQGDTLYLEQDQVNVDAGFQLNTQEGGSTWPNIYDNSGQLLNDSAQQKGVWVGRSVDLSSFAGQHVSNVAATLTTSPPANTVWDVYYRDVVILSKNGDVHQIYTSTMSPSISQSGAEGQTNLSGVIDLGSGNPYYTISDQVGTAQLDISSGGWPVWKGEFSPFGTELSSATLSQTPAATANRYKFTGKERDAESGLDYFGARYYQSGMARWTSPDWSAEADPIPYSNLNNPQTLNLYIYGGNNPIVQSDPDGHDNGSAWGQCYGNCMMGDGHEDLKALDPDGQKRVQNMSDLLSQSGQPSRLPHATDSVTVTAQPTDPIDDPLPFQMRAVVSVTVKAVQAYMAMKGERNWAGKASGSGNEEKVNQKAQYDPKTKKWWMKDQNGKRKNLGAGFKPSPKQLEKAGLAMTGTAAAGASAWYILETAGAIAIAF